MTRRYQTRARSCSSLLFILLLLVIVLAQWSAGRRPQPTAPSPAPSATATFISRAAVAALPTHTPYLDLDLAALPTFTPTPTPTPTATPTPTPVYTARIGIELVNLRSGPGVDYDVLAVLGENEEVFVIGKTTAGDWLAVRTATGQEGWVAVSFLEAAARLSLPVLTPPPLPTPTPAPPVAPPVAPAAVNTPSPQRAAAGAAAAGAPAPAAPARFARRVLANYFTWYDANGWDACNISAGDRPALLYGSDDPAAIARHMRMALDAGIDGFTAQWATPGDRTDRNFAALLAASEGTGFQSTVVFLRHIWPGASYGSTVEALRYLLTQYGSHPNFLKLDGRPVIFITDVYRVPGLGGSAQNTWAQIRAEVDPNHTAWWIAEGLDPNFLAVFDGLWVYKVTHADYPNDYLKAARWAGRVRAWEQQSGAAKLWVGTLMPGWDDRRAGCRPDVRAPAALFARDRAGGAFYRATYDAAVASHPDLLWIHSFNEWVEGTYIEPSQFYGDAYLNLTREFAAKFKE